MTEEFTMTCMKILFGLNVTPNDLNDDDFDKLKGYVRSIGYNIICFRNETEKTYYFEIKFEKYHSSNSNPFEHLRNYMSKN